MISNSIKVFIIKSSPCNIQKCTSSNEREILMMKLRSLQGSLQKKKRVLGYEMMFEVWLPVFYFSDFLSSVKMMNGGNIYLIYYLSTINYFLRYDF